MKRPLLIFIVIASVFAGGLNFIGNQAQARDHDRAHSAVRSGEVLPLRQILETLRQRFRARVLDAELRQEGSGNQWRYDVKLLDEAGKVANVTVDAKTGRILEVR